MKQLKVYTKFCIKCIRPSEFLELQKYCSKNGVELEVIRTTYLPKKHQEASTLWGEDTYTMFVYDGEKSVDFDEFVKRIKDEPKTIKKSKPVLKGKVK